MHIRSFSAHLKRAFTSPMPYICMILYTVLLLGYTNDSPTQDTVMTQLQQAHRAFSMILCTAFPALAYAITYIDDHNNKFLHHLTMRTGVRSYALSYYTVSVLSGFAVSFAGIALYLTIGALRGGEFNHHIVTNVFQTDFYMYSQWYLDGLMVRYLAASIMEYALGAGAMAGFAAACTTLFRRRVSAVMIPSLYFFVNTILYRLSKHIPVLEKLLDTRIGRILNINELIGPADLVNAAADLPLQHFLFKLLLFGLYAVLFGIITVWMIERSAENA